MSDYAVRYVFALLVFVWVVLVMAAISPNRPSVGDQASLVAFLMFVAFTLVYALQGGVRSMSESCKLVWEGYGRVYEHPTGPLGLEMDVDGGEEHNPVDVMGQVLEAFGPEGRRSLHEYHDVGRVRITIERID